MFGFAAKFHRSLFFLSGPHRPITSWMHYAKARSDFYRTSLVAACLKAKCTVRRTLFLEKRDAVLVGNGGGAANVFLCQALGCHKEQS